MITSHMAIRPFLDKETVSQKHSLLALTHLVVQCELIKGHTRLSYATGHRIIQY
jgi:hypothetical protein